MRHDLFRSAVGLAQEQDEIIADHEPRQAWVVRSGDGGVWVRFGGEPAGAPPAWFPSTVAGLPDGTMGWVYRLGGRKGLFVAAGVGRQVPVVAQGPAISHTTSITTLEWVSGGTVTVPPGTYGVDVVATIPTRKSSSGGAMWSAIRVGGVESEESGAGLSGTGISPGDWFPLSALLRGETVTTDDGIVTLEFGFRGASTAGTTSIAHATMAGTLTRMG